MTAAGWQWVVLAFLAAVGGVIGSFLNVVVYRLPAGRSIVWPGSHCPGCGRPIRWYDNLPVLSWFLLRGRCRDCGGAISWRYPAVEAATMGLFLLLGWWELMGGGGHLPERPLRLGSTILWTPYTVRELAALYVYHLMLCCTLLAAALIEHDHPKAGGSVWVRLFLPGGVWGIAAAFVWPTVHPVPAVGPGPVGWMGGLVGVVDGLVGLAAAAGLGLLWGLLSALLRISSRKKLGTTGFWTPVAGATGLVGLYLGWQAGLAVGLISGLFWMLSGVAARYVFPPRTDPGQPRRAFPIPFSAWLAGGSLLWVLFWNQWIAWGKAFV